jgi:hypothetical protein
VVASRGDTYLAGSLFEMFRLLRVSLIEQVGCREISIFFESALILHGIVTQPVDTVLFIWIFLSVRLRMGMGFSGSFSAGFGCVLNRRSPEARCGPRIGFSGEARHPPRSLRRGGRGTGGTQHHLPIPLIA